MKKRFPLISLILIIAIIALILQRYGEQFFRTILLYLSTAPWARNTITAVPLAQKVAARFVAGEDIQAAIDTTRTLNQQGMKVTLDYLGESVDYAADAVAARNEILTLLDAIEEAKVDATVSVKLSQIGLKIDTKLAADNIRAIVQRAHDYNSFVRIDMEESTVLDDTLDIYRNLRRLDNLHNVGVVIQAYLYRSEADIQRLIIEGAAVRLCKGAYMEPPDVAFPVKADTDANYIKLASMLLGNEARHNGVRVGIATHDEKMINAIKEIAHTHQIPSNAYEFQMLYGIRRDLQEQLVADGHRLRVYVPYGTAWYPYFVRRLAERPANLWFFVSNFVRR